MSEWPACPNSAVILSVRGLREHLQQEILEGARRSPLAAGVKRNAGDSGSAPDSDARGTLYRLN